MREINKEIKSYRTVFAAFDGTEFNDRNECLLYEGSAKGILKDKFMRLVVREIDQYSLMFGNEDNIVYYIQFREESDIDTLMQYFYLQHPWILNDDAEKDRLDYITIARRAFNNGEPLLMGTDYEGNLFFMGPLSEIVANISNYDRE